MPSVRGETSGREDDRPEVIAKRIPEYYSKTEPVAQHYEAQGKLERIKGDNSIPDTFKHLSREIDKYLLPA